MTTVILSIVILGLLVALGFTTIKNQFLQTNIDALETSLEMARKEKELIEAKQQLLRNEVTVLKSQIQVMESKSMHAIVSDDSKPKKKKFIPKMKSKKNEQK